MATRTSRETVGIPARSPATMPHARKNAMRRAGQKDLPAWREGCTMHHVDCVRQVRRAPGRAAAV